MHKKQHLAEKRVKIKRRIRSIWPEFPTEMNALQFESLQALLDKLESKMIEDIILVDD